MRLRQANAAQNGRTACEESTQSMLILPGVSIKMDEEKIKEHGNDNNQQDPEMKKKNCAIL